MSDKINNDFRNDLVKSVSVNIGNHKHCKYELCISCREMMITEYIDMGTSYVGDNLCHKCSRKKISNRINEVNDVSLMIPLEYHYKRFNNKNIRKNHGRKI